MGALNSGTSSNVEELTGSLFSLIRSRPTCDENPSKLNELRVLLRKGAPANACSRNLYDGRHEGQSILELCCEQQDFLASKELIRHGADVRLQTRNGTALHALVHRSPAYGTGVEKFEQILNLLMTSWPGIINATDSNSSTALHLAAYACYPDYISSLISHGADLIASSHERVVNYFNIILPSRPLAFAMRLGNLATILAFLQNGDSFHDFNVHSVLFLVYFKYINLDVLKLFVEAGLNVSKLSAHEWCRLETRLDSFHNQGYKWPPEFLDWLKGPKPLALLCRQAIRHSIGYSNLKKISLLPLPKPVKDTLLYNVEGLHMKGFTPQQLKSMYIYGSGQIVKVM